MVNPLMSSKQEPFSGISDVLGASSSLVKLELDHSDHCDDDDNKIEVKLEVLDEIFGSGFGFANHMLIDTDSKESLIGGECLLGPPPSYPGTDLPGAPMVKTVKVPLSSEVNDGPFPPVLSIPGVSGSFSLTSPITSGLHISISPHTQGPDTTTLTSPPPSLSSSSPSCSNHKKPVFTAKGLKFNNYLSI